MSYEPTVAAAAPAPGYPVRLDIDHPEKLSRLLNGLFFIKWIFVIPPYIILFLLMGFAYIPIAAFFAILFRRKYPRWWFDAYVNLQRYQLRITAYLLLLRDDYPALDEEQAVHLEADYPERLNRWLPLIKWLLVIPHFVVLIVLGILAYVFVLIGWVAIIFTGNFPRGLFNFVVGVYRWNTRVSAYAFWLATDQYPPFSMM